MEPEKKDALHIVMKEFQGSLFKVVEAALKIKPVNEDLCWEIVSFAVDASGYHHPANVNQ